MTVIEELIRIVRERQRRGMRFAELSARNLAVLGQLRAASTAQPRREVRATAPPPSDASNTAPSAAPWTNPLMGQFPQRPVAVSRQPTATFAPPPDVRYADWDGLCQACLACHSCGLCATRHKVVIEDGCRAAPLMFIGEGPGADEDAQGVPFVGKAGQLLTRMIAAMGRDRAATDPAKAVYIANIVKCRPPRNRNPLLEEAQACMGYLHRQIALVRPEVIVLLGNVALKFMTGHSGIMNARGKWLEVHGIPAMPTFHPSYVIRLEQDPKQFHDTKLLVWQDLQLVMAKLVENQSKSH